jgi:predicted SAM-dependent methyltransferase
MKLHLGCWKRDIPGFVNIDLCDLPHIHYNSSIDKLPFIEDNTVELIYCSHSLEYYDYDGIMACLSEWNRVLHKGGILRLAVPDFDKLIEVYLASGRDLNRILGPLFGRMIIQTEKGEQIIYHKIVLNYELLSTLLIQSGFELIRSWDWRETEHSDYDDHSQAYFPHMNKDNGILISLNVQCSKPK